MPFTGAHWNPAYRGRGGAKVQNGASLQTTTFGLLHLAAARVFLQTTTFGAHRSRALALALVFRRAAGSRGGAEGEREAFKAPPKGLKPLGEQ